MKYQILKYLIPKSQIKKEFKNLNKSLIESKGLTQNEVEEIAVLHILKNWMYQHTKSYCIDEASTIEFNDFMKEIEFQAQKLWKFNQNADYHTWWLYNPHCTCPTLDNRDWCGTEYRIINGACPLHGITKGFKMEKT